RPDRLAARPPRRSRRQAPRSSWPRDRSARGSTGSPPQLVLLACYAGRVGGAPRGRFLVQRGTRDLEHGAADEAPAPARAPRRARSAAPSASSHGQPSAPPPPPELGGGLTLTAIARLLSAGLLSEPPDDAVTAICCAPAATPVSVSASTMLPRAASACG